MSAQQNLSPPAQPVKLVMHTVTVFLGFVSNGTVSNKYWLWNKVRFMVQICLLASFSLPCVLNYYFYLSHFPLYSFFSSPSFQALVSSVFPSSPNLLLSAFTGSHRDPLPSSSVLSSWLRGANSTWFLSICPLFLFGLPEISELKSNLAPSIAIGNGCHWHLHRRPPVGLCTPISCWLELSELTVWTWAGCRPWILNSVLA